jgi:hypothetical protein
MESSSLVFILQAKLAAADAMAQACLSMIQRGELDPANELAGACFRYLQGIPVLIEQESQGNVRTPQDTEAAPAQNGTIELVPIETMYDKTLMLPASLRAEFAEGYRFTLDGTLVCSGWRTENAERNYCVEWVEFELDGCSGRATYDSEADIAYRREENDKRRRLARQRASLVKQTKAELGATSPKLLAAANAVLEVSRSRLTDEGVAELQAYIARLPGRLALAAADQMRAGISLADGMANAVQHLAGQTEKRTSALLGLRKYQRQLNLPPS